MDYLQIGSSWLHLLATVMLLGYVGVLGLVVLPVLRRDMEIPDACELIAALERRALPGMAFALVALLASGVYLTTSDPRYGGTGDIVGSSWAAIITLKHALIAVVLGLGLYADGLIARRLAIPEAAARGAALARLGAIVNVIAFAGAAVLLLTVAAEAS